jgi:hypothetical protein
VSGAYSDLAGLVTFRPLERPVAAAGRFSPFTAGWTGTVELLVKELRAHGARTVVLEVDMRETDLRRDGMPRADRRAKSPGIVLSFEATKVPGKPQLRYEVGTYSDWQANLRAIALGLRDLRAVDRHGVTRRGEQYAGWKALSAGPAGEDDGDPVRGKALVAEHGGISAALRATHPDHGGDARALRDVIAYRDQETP